MKHAIVVKGPQPLLQFKRSSVDADDPSSMTLAELILHLSATGWHDEECNQPKKAKPYTSGEDKVWYRSTKKISHLYLQALSIADANIKSKLICEVHHFQPQAYYRAILAGKKPLPNQCLDYYKIIMGSDPADAKIGPKTDSSNTASDGMGMMDETG